ncbi:MAG TPA: type 4a pilus biogenesis protein PilO, partial [Gammaproteobacteria bacterium]|nr:type 4a pilus biogenesis protein PilO [Gammaproteobacteria bacterium]
MNALKLYVYRLTLHTRLTQALLFSAYLIVFGLGFSLLLHEHIMHLFSVQHKFKALSLAIIKAEQEVHHLAVYQQRWQDINQNFLNRGSDQWVDLTPFLVELERLAHDAKLEHIVIRVGEDFPELLHRVYPLEITLSGHYAQMLAFIQALQVFPNVLTLDLKFKSAQVFPL